MRADHWGVVDSVRIKTRQTGRAGWREMERQRRGLDTRTTLAFLYDHTSCVLVIKEVASCDWLRGVDCVLGALYGRCRGRGEGENLCPDVNVVNERRDGVGEVRPVRGGVTRSVLRLRIVQTVRDHLNLNTELRWCKKRVLKASLNGNDPIG